MSEELAKWYVVHTYSGYENKVKKSILKAVENRGLSELIHDVAIPLDGAEDNPNGEKGVDHKLFPGYVLIRMVLTDESWYVVRNTRGVTGFVGPGSKPVALTDKEVAALGIRKNASSDVSYSVGESVKVIDGPLGGFVGIIDEINTEKKRVKVSVSMFGRETPVELEFDQIEEITE